MLLNFSVWMGTGVSNMVNRWLLSFVYFFGKMACQCCWLAPRWCHLGTASLTPEWRHFFIYISNKQPISLQTLVQWEKKKEKYKKVPGVNFTYILWAAFAPKSFRQEITNPNCKHIKAAQKNFCIKKLLKKYWWHWHQVYSPAQVNYNKPSLV